MDNAFKESDLIGLNLSIDFNAFKDYEIYVRGHHKSKEKIKGSFLDMSVHQTPQATHELIVARTKAGRFKMMVVLLLCFLIQIKIRNVAK